MQTAGMAIFAVHVSLSSKGYTNHAHVVHGAVPGGKPRGTFPEHAHACLTVMGP
jgi:hypothetical protein